MSPVVHPKSAGRGTSNHDERRRKSVIKKNKVYPFLGVQGKRGNVHWNHPTKTRKRRTGPRGSRIPWECAPSAQGSWEELNPLGDSEAVC